MIKPASSVSIDHKLILLVFLFFASVFISSLLGVDFSKSVWGNFYRADGLFTLIHLVVFSLIIAFFYNQSWEKPLKRTINLSTLLLSLWLVSDWVRFYLFKDPLVPNWQGAIGGPFGQPNFAGGYLLIVLPFFYCFCQQSQHKRLFSFLALILSIIALFFTAAWGAVLGVFFFFWLIYLIQNRKKGLYLWLVTITTVVGTTLIFYYFLSRNFIFFAEGRQRILIKVFLGALKKPLLGWGWANVDYAFQAVPYPFFYRYDIYLDKAHSMLLEVFTASGLVGLIFYLSIVIYALKRLFFLSYREKNSAFYKILLVVFLLFLFHSQTNVISIAEEVYFWLIIGILAAKEKSGI